MKKVKYIYFKIVAYLSGVRSPARMRSSRLYVAPVRMRAAAIPDSSLYQKNDTNIKETIGGVFLKVEITEKEKAAIERGLNQGGGAPEVTVKVENGKVVVLKVKKEKIS